MSLLHRDVPLEVGIDVGLHWRDNVEVCGAAKTRPSAAWHAPPRPTPPPGHVSLELIFRDVERSMEDTQDIDIAVILDEVCDAVVPVEQYPDMTR
jgi:hypothetical protein